MRISEIFVTVDVVLIRENNHQLELLLIKRKNEPYKNDWALPGGFVDKNEDLETAAIRELKEETSIEAKLKSEVVIFKDSHTLQGETSEHQVFECEYISGEPKLSDDSIEVSKTNENNTYEPVWVDIEDIKDLNIKPVKTREFLASFALDAVK